MGVGGSGWVCGGEWGWEGVWGGLIGVRLDGSTVNKAFSNLNQSCN